jgi:pimeloyl-ACP methyl ester carboxylesterase
LALGWCVVACSTTSTATATATGESDPRPDAPATTSPTEDPEPAIPDDWRPLPLEWTPCDLPRDGRCATLRVPLDWDRPDGPTIGLAIGRLSATGDRIGSLVLNPGGPGGSGLEYLGHDPLGAPVAERFDVVAFDPRGVGSSSAPTCSATTDELVAVDPDPDTPDERLELEAAAAALAGRCAATDAELLPHVGTTDVARDLEALRRALGDEPLNFLGYSYGTSIGQQYLEMFPGEVRTMVLDGVVDPALGYQEFLVGQAVAFEAAFDRSAAACATAGPAACGVSDLVAAYDEVAGTVDTGPLPGGDVPVGPAVVATAAISASYGPDGWRRLGPALAQALEGDGAALWSLAAAYYDFGGFTSYASVVCIDSPPPRGVEAYRRFAEAARAAAPRFGGAVANELLPCATWPVPAVGEPAALRGVGAPPVLVIGNTGDAATPYENAVTVAGRLESGVLVTVESDGHTAVGSNECVDALVASYLIALTVPAPDTRCS